VAVEQENDDPDRDDTDGDAQLGQEITRATADAP
jgi:hypothetical protein